MDKSYKRVENIDELIQEVKLTYNAWRILFLVDENTSAGQISEILEDEIKTVEDDLQILMDAKLIEAVAEEITEEEQVEVEEDVDIEPEVDEQVSEEDASEEQPEEEEQPEPVLEESSEEEVEPEEIIEEPVSETKEFEAEEIQDEEPIISEEISDLIEEGQKESEETGIEELLEEKPEPATEFEETPVEDEMPELTDEGTEEEKEIPDQDIEINIHDEDTSEADLLDVDFADEQAEETTEEETAEVEPPAEPEEEAVVEETPAAPIEAAVGDGGEKSVLVVDDSIVIRKMVEIALENEDLEIYTAVSGKDGLEKIDSVNPSLIILDLMLPDINGIDILKTVKASKDIPVIMLSGKDSPQMVEKAKETGANAFLPKPFKDDELIDQIKTLLNM